MTAPGSPPPAGGPRANWCCTLPRQTRPVNTEPAGRPPDRLGTDPEHEHPASDPRPVAVAAATTPPGPDPSWTVLAHDVATEPPRPNQRVAQYARRRQKRPSAPFSKGNPKQTPKRPGHTAGAAHGRHGNRAAPAGPPDRDPSGPAAGVLPRLRRAGLPRSRRGAVAGRGPRPQGGHDPLHGRRRPLRRPCPPAAGTPPRAGLRRPRRRWGADRAEGERAGCVAALRARVELRRVGQVLGHLALPASRAAICRSAARSACNDPVPVHHDLVARANRASTLVMDESGWRVGGDGKWLWLAANAELTLGWIGDGPGIEQASDVIAADYTWCATATWSTTNTPRRRITPAPCTSCGAATNGSGPVRRRRQSRRRGQDDHQRRPRRPGASHSRRAGRLPQASAGPVSAPCAPRRPVATPTGACSSTSLTKPTPCSASLPSRGSTPPSSEASKPSGPVS